MTDAETVPGKIERGSGDLESLREKVAFMRRPESYPHRPARVQAIETHMAWVFLAGPEVFKLKKPVRYDVIDFGTLAARKRDCEEEVRLNRRLAPDVYRGILPLRRSMRASLTLDDDGDPVEWLVHMRRLPRDRMLDARIEAGRVDLREIRKVIEILVPFYRRAEQVRLSPDEYIARFRLEVERSRGDLREVGVELPLNQVEVVADGLRGFLSAREGILEARVHAGLVVEGHGDLRPEHVCLESRPVIIDCLEFDRDLRTVEPADDLSFLAVECIRLGAPEVGDAILRDYREISGDDPPASLLAFYKSFRSLVRAKLAAWHLRDDQIRDHQKWIRRARSHLDLALDCLPTIQR